MNNSKNNNIKTGVNAVDWEKAAETLKNLENIFAGFDHSNYKADPIYPEFVTTGQGGKINLEKAAPATAPKNDRQPGGNS